MGGVVLSADGLLDTSSNVGRLATNVLLALADFELNRYRENWAAVTEHAVASRKYQGITPVGYDRLTDGRLAQNADAPAVRERASGRSWNNLASDLEAAGVQTVKGSDRWHINSIRSLVSHPIYKGTVANGIAHHFPEYAIVTPSEWQAAQPVTEEPGARRERGNWAVLGGLVFCSGCGHRMSPNRTTQKGKTFLILPMQIPGVSRQGADRSRGA